MPGRLLPPATVRSREALVAWYGWQWHRMRVDRFGGLVGHRRPGHQRLVCVTMPGRLTSSQVHPFHHDRRAAESRHRTTFEEVSWRRLERGPLPVDEDVDIVCFQTWYDLDDAAMRARVDLLRDAFPGARLVYLDWFAPTDLRYAAVLEPQVDLYVKKHVLRDRSSYGKPTRGDTNLTDYYAPMFGIDLPEVTFEVPGALLDKLVVGPSFLTDGALMPGFLPPDPPEPVHADRPIDVHARVGRKGDGWYGMLRRHAQEAADGLRDVRLASEGRVTQREFLRELQSSKLCFSPFGFGEVSWRDYEAAMSGAVLLKPDMDHVETSPDLFRKGESYVPVRWDLADLQDTVDHCLAHPEEMEAMRRAAYAVMRDYLISGAFVDSMQRVFELPETARA